MNELNIPDCHTKLLPCPFCGNDNIHITKKPLWHEFDGCYTGYKDRYAFEVVCNRCGAHPSYCSNDTVYRSEEEAISHVVNEWNSRTMSSMDEAKDESQCDWALVYEYARSMKNYLDDLDEVELDACIERVKEIAMEHGGNRIDQLRSYVKKNNEKCREDTESCISIIEDTNWLLTRTYNIEKQEKLHSIALEATKVLRKSVNTP